MCVIARQKPLHRDRIGAMKPAIRIRVRILMACIGLTAAAPASADPLLATRNIIAIMAGELYVGTAEGHINGSGTVVIHAQRNPALTCSGQFASNTKTGGFGHLECGDGTTATFRFQRVTVLRGHGTGAYSRGPMSFAYGMDPAEASLFLKLPAGKRLVHNGTNLAMIDK
jgi:hypothetical protein